MAAEELAFCDALAENGSARDLMERETLRTLAQLLVKTIRSTVTVGWTQKESVRAKRRIELRKLPARYGYSPDLQKAPSGQRCFLAVVAVKSGSFFATQSTNLRTLG